MKKIIYALVVFLSIFSISSCNIRDKKENSEHVHDYAPYIITKNATCEYDGVQRSFCSCGEYLEQHIPRTDHTFLENICTSCGINYHDTDTYKYGKLKPYADKIAIHLSKKYVISQYDDDLDIDFLNTKIVETDKYFGYVVKVEYEITDKMDEKRVSKKEIALRLYDDLHVAAQILEINSNNSLYICKLSLNWDRRPEDFTYDIYNVFYSPTRISLSDLLNNPQKYEGKYIELRDTLYLNQANRLRESYTVSTSSVLNQNNSIELLYHLYLTEVPDPIVINSKVYNVSGYVEFYTDSNKVYIHLYNIEFK